MKYVIMAGAFAAVVLLPQSSMAHHSFAMFDNAKEITIVGVVKQFQWTNPHTWVQLMVTTPSGAVEEWSIEGASPNGLARQGWRKTSITPGEKLSVKIHPLKNGQRGGSLMTATRPDGQIVGGAPQRP